MISFFLKSCAYFSLSFVILSYPVNNRPIFNYVSQLARPLTEKVLYEVEEGLNRTWERSKNFAKKLFSNATPTSLDWSGENTNLSTLRIKEKELYENQGESQWEETSIATSYEEEQDSLNHLEGQSSADSGDEAEKDGLSQDGPQFVNDPEALKTLMNTL